MQSGLLFNLNTFVNRGIWRALSTRKGWPCSSLDTLIGQGNFGFCCSSPFSTRTCVPLLGSNCHFCNRSSCSAVRAVSHSGPIVPGYTCPAFEYTGHPSYRRIMAASGSKAASGEIVVDGLISNCGTVTTFAKPTGVFFSDRSPRSFPRVSMSVKIREPNDKDLNGNFTFGNTWKSHSSYPLLERCVRSYNTSSSPCYSGGAAPDGSSSDDQAVSLAISADQKLKLVSGSCYLPHPDKEETGGEDAHFICTDEQVIGVADGVGGWADVGVNAGEYSRQLMSNSVTAVQNEPKGSIDPARVLEKAHSSTKAMGSSTACIITLTDQGIHAINLGDSGFIVVRDGCTFFQSPVQQHGFNFTYQLENNSRGDPPSSGQIFTIAVAPGDVIVAGTDGLFDNLYNNEITSIVAHAVRAGLGPESTAQKIAALARERALDRSRQTPFSAAAQEAGFRYYGGKLDDITVVVSFITSSADA